MKRIFKILILVWMAAILSAGAVIAASADASLTEAETDAFRLTVSSAIVNASDANLAAKHLVDGDKGTEWRAAWVAEMSPSCDEWALFAFKTTRKISAVVITETEQRTYFPAEFKFTWSMHNDVDIDIPGQSYSNFTPTADGRDNRFVFEQPVVANYFKLSVSKRSAAGGIYLLSIAEIEFEDEVATEAEIEEAERADAAAERPKVIKDPFIETTVTASSELEPEKDWGAKNLSDGTVANQWCSEWVNVESETDEIWVLMTSVDPKKFTGVILYSQGNICFPKDFRFQYSFNGTDYIDIPGASYTDYEVGESTTHVFAFDQPQVATAIRLMITKKRANPEGNYLVQIAEVDPRGFDPTAEEIKAAEDAFNLATDNVPVQPGTKPTPIPVGPEDLIESDCGSALGTGSLLLSGLALAAGIIGLKKGGKKDE